MPVIEITSLTHPGVEVFHALTEAQLRQQKDNEWGLFIAESQPQSNTSGPQCGLPSHSPALRGETYKGRRRPHHRPVPRNARIRRGATIAQPAHGVYAHPRRSLRHAQESTAIRGGNM